MRKNKLFFGVFAVLFPMVCFGKNIKGKITTVDSTSFIRFIVYEIQCKKTVMKLIAYKSEYPNRLLKGHCYALSVERQYTIQLNDGHFFSLERGFAIVDEHGKQQGKDLFERNQPVYKIMPQ
jgi:hypothetical protein